MRRFRHAIAALSKDIRLVMTVSRGAGWQGFLVITDTVFVEEWLIDEILCDHHPRQRVHQRRIGTGANRDPFIFTTGTGIRIARIDDDHPGIRFCARLLEVIGHPTAAHTRFTRIVAEQNHQFAVFDIGRAVAVGPAAVGVIQPFGDLRRGVITVVIEITAAAVHQTGNQRFSRWP
ncbi:hypothetical protein D3C72_888560 [compost metagenome]